MIIQRNCSGHRGIINKPRRSKMYKILEKKQLSENIIWMVVEAERIARFCQPGQFVIVRTDADSERVPLTVCDYDREKGTIAIVFQPIGESTTLMAQLQEGD